MSYTLYFIGHSFQSELPWQRCDPQWANGTNCTVRTKNASLQIDYSNLSLTFVHFNSHSVKFFRGICFIESGNYH
jgi:hypothetical protein